MKMNIQVALVIDYDPIARETRSIEMASGDLTVAELRHLLREPKGADVWVTQEVKLGEKIPFIKEIRSITGLGLKEAKDASEGLTPIARNVPLADAEEMKQRLALFGAVIELR
jgi:ribosomal protein L7/L12